MKNVIIFTGPDRSGKTEIAKHLAKLTGMPYYKASTERATALSGGADFINQLKYGDFKVIDLLSQTGQSVIMDRAYPCEWVYAPVMGRDTDFEALNDLDAAYADAGAKIIICQRSSYSGLSDDLDSRLNSEKLQQLSGRYDLFKEWTQCSTYSLNVDSEDVNAQTTEILKFLEGA